MKPSNLPARPICTDTADVICHRLAEAGFGVGLDPTTVLQILLAVVGLFLSCGLTAVQVRDRLDYPRKLDRVTLRRLIRNHAHGVDHDAVEAAFWDQADACTLHDLERMLTEVGEGS